MTSHEKVQQAALKVLENCCTESGILASPRSKDNYRRIWSRDAMMAGITGALCNHEVLCRAHLKSVLTLLQHQANDGQIPSNVEPGPTPKVSFGTLAGRVDATTWWIVGACFAVQSTECSEADRQKIGEGIKKALLVLESWEMNHRGLVYTPLGGNWADEYLIQGYTLYDNCLRIWALRLAGRVYEQPSWLEQANQISSLIQRNFYPGTKDDSALYHPEAYKSAARIPTDWMWMSLGPQGYDTRWDMAGNALALLLKLHPAPHELEAVVLRMAQQTPGQMVPAFYPVVLPGEIEWSLLEKNHSYSFKNKPFHFHNGGCWPVMMGWLGLGFRLNGLDSVPAAFLASVSEAVLNENPPLSFHEYWSGDKGEPGGVQPLGFTACGCLLLNTAVYTNTLSMDWFPYDI